MRTKVPVYEEVKQQIKARIESGEWASGERVPSEYELVNALGIGRHRARQAPEGAPAAQATGMGTGTPPSTPPPAAPPPTA